MTKTTTALTDDLQFGADETRNAAPDHKGDKLLWGAKAIAKEIDAELRPTFHLLERGYVPAGKVGNTWVTTRFRLREFFDGKIAAAAAAEKSVPAPSKAPSTAPKRGKRKRRHTEPNHE
jgi:hypothetical protein